MSCESCGSVPKNEKKSVSRHKLVIHPEFDSCHHRTTPTKHGNLDIRVIVGACPHVMTMTSCFT